MRNYFLTKLINDKETYEYYKSLLKTLNDINIILKTLDKGDYND